MGMPVSMDFENCTISATDTAAARAAILSLHSDEALREHGRAGYSWVHPPTIDESLEEAIGRWNFVVEDGDEPGSLVVVEHDGEKWGDGYDAFFNALLPFFPEGARITIEADGFYDDDYDTGVIGWRRTKENGVWRCEKLVGLWVADTEDGGSS